MVAAVVFATLGLAAGGLVTFAFVLHANFYINSRVIPRRGADGALAMRIVYYLLHNHHLVIPHSILQRSLSSLL
ncbi:hypothetical protein EDC01DRAFT_660707 [Geopyxis carbonaria]|nr:hypothetical protein EDC01DRAFT_660707 [Geopyxis carbonaria]